MLPDRPDLQAWVRAGLYGLASSVRQGGDSSISPVGLTSDNYAGLIFWDAETWMYPGLLLLHPEAAKAVVEYRYRTLPGAPAPTRSYQVLTSLDGSSWSRAPHADRNGVLQHPLDARYVRVDLTRPADAPGTGLREFEVA